MTDDDRHPHRHRRAAPGPGTGRARRARPPRRDRAAVRRRPGHRAAARRGRDRGPRARRAVRHPRAQRPPRRPGRRGHDPLGPGHAAPGGSAADRRGRGRVRPASRRACSTRSSTTSRCGSSTCRSAPRSSTSDRSRCRRAGRGLAQRRRHRSSSKRWACTTNRSRKRSRYRITTPAGVVVISGDTRVCDEVRELAAGADVLVHEACRRQRHGAAHRRARRSSTIFDYHADTVALGELAEAAGVGHLVLTHLIPPPPDAAAEQAFADDVRRGRLHRPAHRRPRPLHGRDRLNPRPPATT